MKSMAVMANGVIPAQFRAAAMATMWLLLMPSLLFAAPAEKPAQVRVTRDNSAFGIPVFRPGECVKVELSAPAKGLRWVDAFDREVPVADITAFTPAANGAYRLMDGQRVVYQLVVMTPAVKKRPRGAFRFGVCAHPERFSPAEQRRFLQAAALCGVGTIRLDARWRLLERAPGKWDFQQFDQLLALLEELGLEAAPILADPPQWALRDDYPPANPEAKGFGTIALPPKHDLWAEYLQHIARRYGKRLKLVELWNEPDLLMFANFKPEEYLALLRVARQVFEAEAPQVQLMSGGISTAFPSSPSRSADADYARKILQQGKGLYHIYGVHFHGLFPWYRREIDAFKALGVDKNLRWYSNESAIYSSGGIGELRQAQTLFAKLLYAWQNGAIGYNWYNLVEKNDWPVGNAERHYGMLTPEGYPKAVYGVMNTLTQELSDGEFLREVPVNPALHALLFRRGEARILAYWRKEENDQSRRWIFVHGFQGEAEQVDIFGNRRKITVDAKRPYLQIDDYAGMVVLPQGGNVTFSGEVVEAVSPLAVLPNGKASWRFRIHNHRQEPMMSTVAIHAATALQIQPAVSELSLAAGEKKEFQVEVTAPSDVPSQVTVTLEVTAPPLFQGRMEFAARREYRLGKDYPQECNFRLDSREQAVSLMPAAPGSEFYSGVADLSGELFLRQDGAALYIRVVVTDDKHLPFGEGEALWRGDSIQVGLSLPRQKGVWVLGQNECSTWIWDAPAGFSARFARRKLSGEWRRLPDGRCCYELKVPYGAIGLTQELLQEGIAFNLLINDSDRPGIRKSFIRIAPGLGDELTPAQWPVVRSE